MRQFSRKVTHNGRQRHSATQSPPTTSEVRVDRRAGVLLTSEQPEAVFTYQCNAPGVFRLGVAMTPVTRPLIANARLQVLLEGIGEKRVTVLDGSRWVYLAEQAKPGVVKVRIRSIGLDAATCEMTVCAPA